ncbi:uncharacterized protein LOC132737045 [Ruditapes philippinarum]|uniref:uncharacterized protein LOC132737045 n=1 Tax=Ruditapes philippinarum TaxID=129788 RepID=UPI00295B30AD|nr:uncharacterized protein LOC132737045 [Ruditapes philippinarum]
MSKSVHRSKPVIPPKPKEILNKATKFIQENSLMKQNVDSNILKTRPKVPPKPVLKCTLNKTTAVTDSKCLHSPAKDESVKKRPSVPPKPTLKPKTDSKDDEANFVNLQENAKENESVPGPSKPVLGSIVSEKNDIKDFIPLQHDLIDDYNSHDAQVQTAHQISTSNNEYKQNAFLSNNEKEKTLFYNVTGNFMEGDGNANKTHETQIFTSASDFSIQSFSKLNTNNDKNDKGDKTEESQEAISDKVDILLNVNPLCSKELSADSNQEKTCIRGYVDSLILPPSPLILKGSESFEDARITNIDESSSKHKEELNNKMITKDCVNIIQTNDHARSEIEIMDITDEEMLKQAIKTEHDSKTDHDDFSISSQSEYENVNKTFLPEDTLSKEHSETYATRKRSDKEYFVPFSLRPNITKDEGKILNIKDLQQTDMKRTADELTLIPPRPKLEKVYYVSESNTISSFSPYLELRHGEICEILDDSNKEFWIARKGDGKIGRIASRFVCSKPELDMNPWFYKDVTSQHCEYILSEVGIDGCFIVHEADYSPYVLLLFSEDRTGGQVYRYPINLKNKYFFLNPQTLFVSMPDLIRYHYKRSGCLRTFLKCSPPLRYKETQDFPFSDKLEIEKNDLEIFGKIGSGNFGVIHRGKFGRTEIAVEIVKNIHSFHEDMLMEARIMSHLNHPNLVQLYGIVSKSLPLMKITEFMQNGNLYRFLKANRLGLLLCCEVLTDMCRQVCRGMEYLHNQGYILRNLSAKNCSVGKNGIVKVSNFATARFVRKGETVTFNAIQVPWAPPEVYHSGKGDIKSDIWSFGVLMWEIFTCGDVPFIYERNRKGKRIQIYRPPKPTSCPQDIDMLMLRCWKLEPSNRPTFKDLKTRLEECYLKIQDDEDNSDSQSLAELGFDHVDKQLFMHALKEGNESDSFIRVMVVGNFNQGKTSLTRRLLQLPMENIESTDGIDIHAANCEDNVTWKTTVSHAAEIKGARRLANIFIQSIKTTITETLEDGNEQEDSMMLQGECNDTDDKDAESFENDDTCNSLDEIVNQGDCLEAVSDEDFSETSFSETSSEDNSEKEECFTSGSDVSEDKAITNDPDLHIKAVDLLSEFTEKLKDENNYTLDKNENSININIWDFGGQFIYYATHQIFHSRDAIYLLVFDLTKDLDSMVHDEDFPDRKFDMRTCLKFWIMSVHAFVGTKDGKEPKIILVGTHKADCISKSNIEKKFDDVYDLFIKSKARNHIYKMPFAIENTDPNDPGITELKRALFEIGLEKAKASKVPAKWIQLEEALKGNKENRKILKYEDVQTIDKSTDLPINDEDQLKLFLKYHHAKGTIVYFDEEKLREFVVIDPQFLVDAFKCIITSKRFCKWRSDIHELWEKLIETAVLDKYLLNSIWEHDDKNRFMEHRDILLAFLQRHRILAEMQVIDEITSDARGTGKYIVPSLLKSEGDQSILKKCVEGKNYSLVILGLSLEDTTIIKTVFERTIAAALERWPPIEIDGISLVFQSTSFYLLDLQHAGIIAYSSERGIELAVVNQCPPANVESVVCDRFRRFVETVVLNEFRRHNCSRNDNPFTYYLKCNHAVHKCQGSKNVHYGLENIKKKYRVCCPDNSNHAIITKSALAEWFQDGTIINNEKGLQKKVTEKYLTKVAQTIGQNWELLGPMLGVSKVDVERIKMDHKHCTETAIFYMLHKWNMQCPDQNTMGDLINTMKECEALSVDWDKVNNILDGFFMQ